MSLKKVATFQERLIEALTAKNITQSELGRAIGITRSGINKYVKGKAIPPLDKIRVISEILGVSEIWLLGYGVSME